MTTTKHIKGPWSVVDIGANCLRIAGEVPTTDLRDVGLNEYYATIATVTQRDTHPRYDGGISRETCQANARLISAAPDFYKACKALIEYCDANPTMGDSLWSVQQIRAAIAKAGGEV